MNPATPPTLISFTTVLSSQHKQLTVPPTLISFTCVFSSRLQQLTVPVSPVHSSPALPMPISSTIASSPRHSPVAANVNAKAKAMAQQKRLLLPKRVEKEKKKVNSDVEAQPDIKAGFACTQIQYNILVTGEWLSDISINE